MKFEIERRIGKFVMNCADADSYKIFLEYLHSKGRSWDGGQSYMDVSDYSPHYSCFMFNEGLRCSVDYAVMNGYTVLSFEDYEWEWMDPIPHDEELLAQNTFLLSFKNKEDI